MCALALLLEDPLDRERREHAKRTLIGGLIVGRKVGRDWLISDVDAREWLTRREREKRT